MLNSNNRTTVESREQQNVNRTKIFLTLTADGRKRGNSPKLYVHLARTGVRHRLKTNPVCFLVFLTPPTLSLLATEAYLCARLASETTELAFLRVGGLRTSPQPCRYHSTACPVSRRTHFQPNSAAVEARRGWAVLRPRTTPPNRTGPRRTRRPPNGSLRIPPQPSAQSKRKPP